MTTKSTKRVKDKDVVVHMNDIEFARHRPTLFFPTFQMSSELYVIFNEAQNKIKYRNVICSPGLIHCFQEAISNVHDVLIKTRENKIHKIGDVVIDVHKDHVLIKNVSEGIQVVYDPDGKLRPYKAFGVFRSSTNYNDDIERLAAGMNGIGIKGVNVYSKKFVTTVLDPINKKKYVGTWLNGMTDYSEEISDYKGKEYSVQIEYWPDFSWMKLPNEFSVDDINIQKAMAYFLSYTSNVPVIFNGTKIHMKSFLDICNVCFTLKSTKDKANYIILNSKPLDRYKYECIVLDSNEGNEPNEIISLVNSAFTQRGVHIDACVTAITKSIQEILMKDKEKANIKPADVKPRLNILLNCVLNRPQFREQAKKDLINADPRPEFEVSAKDKDKLKSWAVVQYLKDFYNAKNIVKMNKKTVVSSDVINHANKKGKHPDCTLYITEGKSAKYYALQLRRLHSKKGINGSDLFGILTLTGKIKNIYNMDGEKSMEYIFTDTNTISNITHSMNFKYGADYSDPREFSQLYYSSIVILTDADYDGKHITSLLTLFLYTNFRTFVERGALKFLRLPIIRVAVSKSENKLFYSQRDFEEWFRTPKGSKTNKNNIKYMKGLGGYTDKQIEEDFQTYDRDLITLISTKNTIGTLETAFSSAHISDRKLWINKFYEELIDGSFKESVIKDNKTTIDNYIKKELIFYSSDSNNRSIPLIGDGFKDSQRKIWFGAGFKLTNSNEVKVAQLQGDIASRTAYLHGENNIGSTIIAMTQQFVPTNNMPLFKGNGNFGSRYEGGKDAASSRYIFVSKEKYTDYIFIDDDIKYIGKRKVEEGEEIEYEEYFPIIPMFLINGVKGIGTGYSTTIPLHNPYDIINWLANKIVNNKNTEIMPWYYNFHGLLLKASTTAAGKSSFITQGLYSTRDKANGKVEVTVEEIPVGTWYEEYRRFLEDYNREHDNKDIITNITKQDNQDGSTYYRFTVDSNQLSINHKNLSLQSTISYNNMTVLIRNESSDGTSVLVPKVYNDIQLLLNDFYTLRLKNYQRRIDAKIPALEKDLHFYKEKLRFIQLVESKKIQVFNVPEEEVEETLIKNKFLDEEHRKTFMDIKFKQVSKQEIEKLRKQIKAIEDDLDYYENITAEDLWYTELEKLYNFLNANKVCGGTQFPMIKKKKARN